MLINVLMHSNQAGYLVFGVTVAPFGLVYVYARVWT